MLAGRLIRVSFVLRHKALAEGRPVPWRYAARARWHRRAARGPHAAPAAARRRGGPAGAELRRGAGHRRASAASSATTPRCRARTCASIRPEAIVAQAQAVHQQTVVLKVMPMNNATQMTDAERAAIGRWFQGAARAALIVLRVACGARA
jgi:uncharacterized membrane protein